MDSLTKLQQTLKISKLLSGQTVDPAIRKAAAAEVGAYNINDAIFAVLDEQAKQLQALKAMLSE